MYNTYKGGTMGKEDIHMHSSYSWDCEMEIEKIATKALEKGLDRIALTDHVEIDDSLFATILKYQESSERSVEISNLQTTLEILRGIEISEPYRVAETYAFYRSLPLDMIIGSVHDFKKGIEEEKDIEKEFKKYYLRNLRSVLKGDFDVLGHLGYIARAYPNYEYQNEKAIDNVLKAIIETDKVLEINTSAMRRCKKCTFPDFSIIKRYKELGGKYVTVGSDAHRYEEIGDNIESGYDIARELELQVVYFKNRQRKI